MGTSNFVPTVWGNPFAVPVWLWPWSQSEVHKNMVRQAESTDLNPRENLWKESNISAWPHKYSFGWMVQTDTLQNVAESLPRRVSAVVGSNEGPRILCINACVFRLGCPSSSYRHDGQVSTEFWPYSVYVSSSCRHLAEAFMQNDELATSNKNNIKVSLNSRITNIQHRAH